MIYRSLPFTIDVDRYQLRAGNRTVALQPKIFDVLVYLVANCERVVTKEELLEVLWPGETVGDASIRRCVEAIRRTWAHNGGDGQGVIKTIRGRGYRFVAPIESTEGRGAEREKTPEPESAVAPVAFREPGFVGREAILQILRSDLDASSAGRGRIVLLTGEPGIGKTRTAEELAAIARSEGVDVYTSRAHPAEGAPDYWPWVQILRSVAAKQSPENLNESMRGRARHLSQLLPELGEWSEARERSGTHPESARFNLFDSVATFLADSSLSNPQLLILEDLHWADVPSLALLHFLSRSIRETRMLVVATFRSVETEVEDARARIFSQLLAEAGCQAVPIGPLTPDEVEQLIEGLLQELPGRAFLNRIAELTAGNPFHVIEMLRLIAAEYGSVAQWSDETSWKLPDSIRAAVAQRLDPLSPACADTLALASVLGRSFSLRILESVSDRSAEDLLHDLDEAVSRRFLTPEGEGRGFYAFPHGLIRQALYESLMESERAGYHLRVAESLESIYAQDIGSVVPELAHHLFHAIPAANPRRAFDYSIKAAELARQVFAWECCVAHLERALELLDLCGAPDPETRCRLHLELGRSQKWSGDERTSIATLERATQIANEIGRPDLAARATLILGFTFFPRPDATDRFVADMLQKALDSVPGGEGRLRAELIAHLAFSVHWHEGDYSLDLGERAAKLAEQSEDPATRGFALLGRTTSFRRPDCFSESAPLVDEMVNLAREADEPELLLKALNFRVEDHLREGKREEFCRDTSEISRLADRYRRTQFLAVAAMVEGARALMEGDYRGARNAIERLSGFAKQTSDPGMPMAVDVLTYSLTAQVGRAADVATPLAGSIRASQPEYRAGVTRLLCALGRREEALREFESMMEDFMHKPAQNMGWMCVVTQMAETCALLRANHHAARFLELLEPHRKRNATMGIYFGGPVSRYIALVNASVGAFEAAFEAYEFGLAGMRRLRARPAEARIQYDYARSLLLRGETGDHEHAIARLRQAQGLARSLGFATLLNSIARVSDRIG